eukprot:4151693-Alexandrium_andersonii.AAC.1
MSLRARILVPVCRCALTCYTSAAVVLRRAFEYSCSAQRAHHLYAYRALPALNGMRRLAKHERVRFSRQGPDPAQKLLPRAR